MKITRQRRARGGSSPSRPIEHVRLIEPKTVQDLDDAHPMLCTNHPKATGLLLRFSKPRLAIKRVLNGQCA